MAILESALGGLFGAVVGLVEKPLAQYMDMKSKKLEYDHVETMQSLQHQQDILMADKELLGEGIKADAAILTESYKHDSSHGESYKWVIAICKLTRPAALILTFGGTFHNPEVFGPAFMMVLAWWFASRVRPTFPK